MKRPPFIAVNGPSLSGYYATLFSWNSIEECYEPESTGFGRYNTKQEAEQEALQWAEDEELEYVPY